MSQRFAATSDFAGEAGRNITARAQAVSVKKVSIDRIGTDRG
jgi:hypothetical protein